MIIKKILPFILFFLTLALIVILFLDSITGIDEEPGQLVIKSDLTGAEILVETDKAGFPVVNTGNSLEAAYSTGFLHAKNMLFRMEVLRHAGYGELSEFFGKKTIYADIFARTMGFRNMAEYYSGKLPSTIKDYLSAYVKGINKFIAEGRKAHPVEFSLLNHEPQPWQPDDVLMLMLLKGWEENPLRFYPEKITLFAREAGADKWNPVFGSLRNTSISDSLLRSDFKGLLPERFLRAEEDFRLYSGMIKGDAYPTIFEQRGNFRFAGVSSYGITAVPSGEYFISFRGDSRYISGKTYAGIPFLYSGIRDSLSWVSSRTEIRDVNKKVVDDTIRISMPYEDTIRIRNAPPQVIQFGKGEGGTKLTDILEFPVQGRPGSRRFLSYRVYFDYDPVKEAELLYGINRLFNKFPGEQAVQGSLVIRFFQPGYTPAPVNEKAAAGGGENKGRAEKKGEKEKKTADAPVFRDGVFSSYPLLREIFHYGDVPESVVFETVAGTQSAELINFQSATNNLKGIYAPLITPVITGVLSGGKSQDKTLNNAAVTLTAWEHDFDPLKQAPLIYFRIIKTYAGMLLESRFSKEETAVILDEFGIPYGLILKNLSAVSYNGSDSLSNVRKNAETERIRRAAAMAVNQLKNEFGTDISLWQYGTESKISFKPLIDPFMDGLPGSGINFGVGVGGSPESLNRTGMKNDNFDIVRNSRIITGGKNNRGFYVSSPSLQLDYRLQNTFRETVISWARGRYYNLTGK